MGKEEPDDPYPLYPPATGFDDRSPTRKSVMRSLKALREVRGLEVRLHLYRYARGLGPGPTAPSAAYKQVFLKLVRNPEGRSRIDACLVRFPLPAGHTLGQCQDQLCHVCLSCPPLSRCRWQGRAHSEDLGGAVKSFLLAPGYYYRVSHYLLSSSELGISTIETVYITPNASDTKRAWGSGAGVRCLRLDSRMAIEPLRLVKVAGP